MKQRYRIVLGVMAVMVAVMVTWAQAQDRTSGSTDAKLDKILKQQEIILKNQTQIINTQKEIMEQLETLRSGVNQLRRRSS